MDTNSGTAPPSLRTAFRWTNFYKILLLVIFLGTAFDNMDQVTCSFILPMMRMEWNLDYIQGSYMPTAALLGTCVGAIFWGMISDRIGRRQALTYTILLFSATNLIQTHSWNYAQFTITCFFMGVGVGGEIPLAFTMLSEFMPAHLRTRTEMVVGILAIVLGYAFSAVSAHFLLPLFGWKSLFYVQALPALLVVVVRLKLPESPRYLLTAGKEEEAWRVAAEIKRRTGGNYDPLDDAVADLSTEDKRQTPIEGLRMLWRDLYRRRTVANWLFGFFIGFFEFAFIIWLPTTLQNLGYSDAQSVNYPMLINFFAIPSVFVALYLLHKGGSKLVLTIYPLVSGVFMLILGGFLPQIAAQPVFLVLVGGVIFFFGTTLLGIFPPYSSEVYPTEVRGTGSGWAAGFTRIGSFIGPLFGGVLLSLHVSAQIVLVIFGAPLLVGSLVMLLYGVQTHNQSLEHISPSYVDKVLTVEAAKQGD
ncbi:MAG TPA: MFS transporter [Ktedonobacteraceae bacterium]|nr:MFS transporter [Ktedonobacteraceae bacterium]